MAAAALGRWTAFWNRRKLHVAASFFILAGLIAVAREVANYRSGHGVDGGHLAIGIGMPITFMTLVWSLHARAKEEQRKQAARHKQLTDEEAQLRNRQSR